MIKRDELTDPESCMSRAKDDEMTFVLLGRDAAAPSTIRFWVAQRVKLGKNEIDDPQMIEAIECANAMERSRAKVQGSNAMNSTTPPLRCFGFGRQEGRCTNSAGTAWSPYWCESCDRDRREHISRNLEEMVRDFGKPTGANP